MTLEPDVEEELPQPHRALRGHPRLRRAQTPILVLLVLVVIVAAVLTLHRTSTTPSAAPSTEVRTVSKVPSTEISGPRATPSVRTGGDDPAICPSAAYCITSPTVPTPVVRAIRDVLPGARQRFATTVVTGLRRHLWFRQVSMTARGVNLQVLIQQPDPDETLRAESDEDGTSRHTFVATHSGGLTVRVVADGPVGRHPGLFEVIRLAADRRLIAVGQ